MLAVAGNHPIAFVGLPQRRTIRRRVTAARHRGWEMRKLIAHMAMIALASAPVSAETSWTPLKLRQVSGTRPFVNVKLNGAPLLFMVHANAGFYAMTNHANARKAGIASVQSTGHYGITSVGNVSNLGSGTATLHTLQVGSDVVHDVPLRVFEIPQKPIMNGMLGIGWLRARRAIVDFSRLRIGVPATAADSAAERQRLVEEGYVAHPLSWDADQKRYTIKVNLNGTTSTFVVSTVSHLVIDDHIAAEARISRGKVLDTYGGPTGTTGKTYRNGSPVELVIGGQKANVPPAVIYDTYDYDAEPRPAIEKQIGGYLGCEFMLPNKAVVDFGEGVLYLKR